MKEITLFHLATCPYCHNIRKALEELRAETPAYEEIRVNWVEESQQPQLAGQYDYYYVPSIFVGDDKLYEAHPSQDYAAIKAHTKAALDAVLKD